MISAVSLSLQKHHLVYTSELIETPPFVNTTAASQQANSVKVSIKVAEKNDLSFLTDSETKLIWNISPDWR